MRVLVTGGAGYIGSVVVEGLVAAGHEPVVFDSLVKGHSGAVLPGVALVQGDVRDSDRVRQALVDHSCEAVIHLAALIEVEASTRRPEAFFDVNVGGGISVVKAMVAANVRRLVFSSTAAIYGDPEQLPIPEDTPTRPTNPYGETKLAVERLLHWAAPAAGLVCTSLRYFNAAGATERNGEAHDPETHLIPLVLQAAEESRPIPIFGADYPTPDGTTVRDYIHVLDLARAHILALRREEPGFRIFNVGNGVGHSVREVIAAARTATGRALQTVEQPRRAGDQAATVASIEAIQRELGWQPQHSEIGEIVGSAWRWRERHPRGYAE